MQIIITVSPGPSAVQVKVDGWLGGAGVAELEQLLASVAGPVRLLAHDLRGADAAGLSVLHRLDREGTVLDGLSPYLRLLIARSADVVAVTAVSVTRSETPVRSENT